MRDESGHLEMAESGDFILATYREIAAHFRLGGPNAARTKAKRAGWNPEPTNHPADPLHIRVPRDAWSQAADTVPRERPGRPPIAREGESISRQRDPPSQGRDTPHIRALEGHIATLREDLAAERAGRLAAEQQRDQALVDLRTERKLSAAEAARLAAATDAAVADARNERARADRAEQGRDAERTRSDALLDQVQGLLTQLTTIEADGKAANDRAWTAGEAAGVLREQVARLEQRIEAERTRADRSEASAANERQDFLDAESRTRQELDGIRQRLEQAEQGREEAAAELHRQVEAAQIAQAEAEADAAELRQADDARKARGRLRRAWDGWRGR
jgi:hypothetical protein